MLSNISFCFDDADDLKLSNASFHEDDDALMSVMIRHGENSASMLA